MSRVKHHPHEAAGFPQDRMAQIPKKATIWLFCRKMGIAILVLGLEIAWSIECVLREWLAAFRMV